MVVVECSVPDCTFTTDDVSEALAIALLSNHNLAHCNLAPIVADAAPAPTAPRSNQAPVSVDSERSSKGVMVTGRGNRVAVGTEQQILRENEARIVWLEEQQKILEKAREVIIRLQQEVDCQDYKCKEKERELLKTDDELSELNLRLTGEIMRINRTIAELKKVSPEMARRTGDRDMDVDMLPVSPESTPEGPGTTGNQEDVMATENTGLRTPLETNSCKDSAVQEKERELLKRDDELSELNLRLTGEIMRNNRTIEELKKVNAEMARWTGDRDMDVGTGTMRNQENLMVTENTRLKTPSETSSHSNSVMQASYTGTEFLKPNNSLGNDEGPSVPAALETGQVVAQLQTLEEENKVLKAKLRELEKNLKRREERIREKEDEVRSIKVRITKKATRNRRTEEELRNKKRELERIKVDLERTHYEKRTAEEVKVLIPEVQRCEVRINEVKEEWRGAKGKVMRGKVRDIEVVIKEPLSTKLEAFKAFKRESDIISQLDHPNVVRCHATFDEHDGQSPWIVQEYANGVTLGYHLNKRLFTLVPFEVLSFALDAGRGLLYLHTLPSPIVHGDLHSGNLLLFIIGSTPPVLKLCDFGKATILGNTMPPNQGPSKKDDVLSFGKLLSDMLLKIKWPDWMARQEQVYFRTSLEQLIERCTKEIPESRPDMQKVVDDLKDLENRYSNFPGQVEQDPVEKYLITKTSFNRH